MKTYVIFDRKTGDILQVHVQAEAHHGGPEHLVRTVRPEAKVDAVDILEVAGLAPGASYRVDVKARKLIHTEGGASKGAAGASVQPLKGDVNRARAVVMYPAERTGGMAKAHEE
jgi:hypothetical protein